MPPLLPCLSPHLPTATLCRRHAASRGALVLLLASCSHLLACGGVDAETVIGSPSPAPEVQSTSIELTGGAHSLQRHNFEIFVATTGAIKQLNDSVLVDVNVISIDGSATTTGTIRAATTLSDGSVFYVADNGFFYGDGERLLPSPLSATIHASGIHALAAAAGSNGGDRLWLGSVGALFRLDGQALEKWDLPSSKTVSAIGESSHALLVAQDDELYELALDGSSTTSVKLDCGRISQIIRHSDGQFYLATEKGLVIRSSDGQYTRYTLTDDESGTPVNALASDPLAGLYLRTSSSIVRMVDAQFGGVANTSSSTTAQLAIDFFGDAWISTDQGMAGYFVAPDLSFEQDGIKSVLQICNNCHSQDNHESADAPYIPFDDHAVASTYAGRIEARLSDAANPMPPSPYTFSNDEYQRVMRWVATGSKP